MTRIDFNLTRDPAGPIRELPVPKELTIPVRGMTLKTARGKTLARGDKVAQPPDALTGDMHASLAGKVSKISFAYVTIAPEGEAAVEPVDLTACEDDKALRRELRQLGVDMTGFEVAEILIINGLNLEPEVTVSEALLANERGVLEQGLAWARKLVAPARCVLVSTGGVQGGALGECEQVVMNPKYPNSLNPLVVKAVTGRETPPNVAVIDVPTLWDLGMTASTGLPLTETVATINGEVYRLPIGAPLGWVLEQVGLAAGDGDMVRLGGPMRGLAAFSLDQGMPKGLRALGVVPASQVAAAPVENVPCINCGECVLRCPARLMPNLITRYVEYDRFEDAKAQGLGLCMECGLCTYYCSARRPLLHLIRFARQELRAKH
ncbi:electron transporter RnfC [Desulfocurvus sp. DL9XJH121]